MIRTPVLRVVWALSLVASAAGFDSIPFSSLVEETPSQVPNWIVPAEFERQDAILMSWDPYDVWTREAIIDILNAMQRRIPVALLVLDDDAQRIAERALRRAGVSLEGIRFIRLPYDTVWARDYGPQVIRDTDGIVRFVDASYEHDVRARDDGVPAALASLLGLSAIEAPLDLDGGNLLSNGAGLILTTHGTREINANRHLDEQGIAQILRDFLGATNVVFLEPLHGEATGHADMFAMFTAPDTILIGSYSRRYDPVNAAVLDRNAAALEGLKTPHGPMKVIRIPMPPHDGDVWRTHTNVLFANDTVLVPIYPGFDRGSRAKALAAMRSALPNWEIASINCNRLIAQGGAIHCVTSSLGRLPRLPESHRISRGPRKRPLIRPIGRSNLPPAILAR